MRTAILFTGGLRTFEKTAPFLLKNLIEPNNATVFVACETESDPTDILEKAFPGVEIVISYQKSYRDTQFDVIANGCIFNSEHAGLRPEVYERSGWNMHWTIEWLKNMSGSMVQWYQLVKVWDLVIEYEAIHNMKFDFCVKSRFDILLKERLDLDAFLVSHPSTEEDMRSLGSDRMKRNPYTETNGYDDPPGTLGTLDNTVWTFGVELVILAKRDVFEPLVQTFYNYGKWDSGRKYSFNSETTFHQHCKHLGLVHYAYQDAGFPLYYSGDVNDCPWVFVILR
jgi:hypothetical protein